MGLSPVWAPDGSVRMIPADQLSQALAAGGQRAVPMKDPQGTQRYVRESEVNAALSAGGTLSDVAAQPSGSQSTIKARQGGVLPWLQDLEGDIRYGTGQTAPGRFLRMLGAAGVNQGVSPETANFMGSPILGTTRMAQGAAEIPSRPWQATKDIVGGGLQAAQIPAMMATPSEAAATKAGQAADVVSGIIPSAARAGGKFREVMAAAKDLPIDTTEPGNVALRIQELAQRGGSMPMVARKFLNRITDPDLGPLSYEEARDFYSNITRLSADEFNRLTPVMKQQVGNLRVALNNALQTAAETGGKGPQYSQAMSEYARAMKLREAGGNVADFVKSQLPWLPAYYVGSKIYGALK